MPVNDHWQKFGPGAVGVGWDLALHGLERHLASGAAVDPAQAMAWMGSAEGAAARTSAAYTGAPPPGDESATAPGDA